MTPIVFNFKSLRKYRAYCTFLLVRIELIVNIVSEYLKRNVWLEKTGLDLDLLVAGVYEVP